MAISTESRRRRRKTPPRRGFEPGDFRLEGRVLLNFSANDPVGVSTDPAGDIFVSYDSSSTQDRASPSRNSRVAAGRFRSFFHTLGGRPIPGRS